jgi:hypothetical protein
MNIVRIAASAVLLASAAGCASPDFSPSKLAGPQFSDPASGIVLVSTGAIGRCVAGAMWAPIYDARTKELVPGRAPLPIDANKESGFSDHYGTLSAVSLPPGHYVITAEWANPVSMPTGYMPAWAFDVVAGQATYIGEIWRSTGCEMSVSLSVRDNFDRDVALAEKLNTGFITHPPKKALAQPLRSKSGG